MMKAAIFQYINSFYSIRRCHAYRDGISPLAFEAAVCGVRWVTGAIPLQVHLFDYFKDNRAARLIESVQTWLRHRRALDAEAIATLTRWADSALARERSPGMMRV